MISSLPTVRLRPHKEDSIKRFHPWVFSGAIASLSEELEDGAHVGVISQSGQPLGVGHFALGSIAVRLLAFGNQSRIDRSLYVAKIRSALELRYRLGLLASATEEGRRNDTFRLIHGEGDGLPGLIVDIYGQTAVLQAHSMGMHHDRYMITDALVEVFTQMQEKHRLTAIYYKSSGTLPTKEQRLASRDEFLWGTNDPDIVWEQGMKFVPDWFGGQKTGFFVDQRDNRALVERYAQGKRVLNAFCYTGGFSLYALRGGATSVHSLDSSSKAMELTEKHIELNFGADCPNHRSITQDAFEFLEQMQEDSYDLIILDPPAFAKHRKAIKNAVVGYRRINAQAFRKIASGGILFTFSCSQAVSKEEFRLAVFTAAASTGRHVRILHQLSQPADHPISIYHPEGEYLKGLVLQVD